MFSLQHLKSPHILCCQREAACVNCGRVAEQVALRGHVRGLVHWGGPCSGRLTEKRGGKVA